MVTHGGADTSLLTQQLDGRLASVDSLQTAVRVFLANIPSVEEALRNLATFAFVALRLFSAGGRHLPAVTEILRFIERLEEIHTKFQGMLSYPHPSTTLLYDVFLVVGPVPEQVRGCVGARVPRSTGGKFPLFA